MRRGGAARCMFSAALLIEQSSPTSAPKVLTDCLAYWKSDPAELVCEERRAWFRERVEQGIADGGRAARRSRERVRLARRGRGDFKP
jgi:hypothetical protein